MSKITVLGGSGYAGAFIVKEAAARGHQVTSLTRTLPAEQTESVTYVTGDAKDAAAVIEGADVVIGALSPLGGSEGTLLRTYTTVAEQAAANGARLFIIGGFGSLRPAPGAPRFVEGDLPPEFADGARELDTVRATLQDHAPNGLDWLFISPAAMFGAYTPQGAPRGEYRTGTGVALFDDSGNSAIEGADFALAVVNEIDNPSHHRAHINYAH